ncbi:MAG: hypothetical protein ABI920_00935 [Casimicrobiaceae bacterium]
MTTLGALALFGLAIGVSGCQQERNTTASIPPGRDVTPASVKSATTSNPAPAPAADPSLPPAESAMKTPGSPADGAYTALTKPERDNALPLEGQTNNHSSDAAAKRGDETIPRESPSSPRGSDAVATPNSYPAREAK